MILASMDKISVPLGEKLHGYLGDENYDWARRHKEYPGMFLQLPYAQMNI